MTVDAICLDGARKISTGQSGAEVFLLSDASVYKRAVRGRVREDIWRACLREARLYLSVPRSELPCLPEIFDIAISEEEIRVLMRGYRPMQREEAGDMEMEKLLGALASIHEHPIPAFLQAEIAARGEESAIDIALCAKGWKDVLAEHGDAFDAGEIDRLAEKIGALETKARACEKTLVHGDFHIENALWDEGGNAIICDWQSVSIGDPAGDISFFLSRLSSDGCAVDPSAFLALYCKVRGALCGAPPRSETLLSSMRLANVLTSFRYWHMYLHGNGEERVRGVLNAMLLDARALIQP